MYFPKASTEKITFKVHTVRRLVANYSNYPLVQNTILQSEVDLLELHWFRGKIVLVWVVNRKKLYLALFVNYRQ